MFTLCLLAFYAVYSWYIESYYFWLVCGRRVLSEKYILPLGTILITWIIRLSLVTTWLQSFACYNWKNVEQRGFLKEKTYNHLQKILEKLRKLRESCNHKQNSRMYNEKLHYNWLQQLSILRLLKTNQWRKRETNPNNLTSQIKKRRPPNKILQIPIWSNEKWPPTII